MTSFADDSSSDSNLLSTYIALYENAVNDELIKEILDRYDYFKDSHGKGLVKAGYKPDTKVSTDFNLKSPMMTKVDGEEIFPIIYNKDLNIKIEKIYNDCLSHYFGSLNPYLDDTFSLFPEKRGASKNKLAFNSHQVQHYPKEVGHFQHYHVDELTKENYFVLSNKQLARMFVFMIYLNDVEKGGETEFLYARKKIIPTKGSVLLWPANWPFLHRGNMPLSGDKYILTSWLVHDPSAVIGKLLNNHKVSI
tara:strand:- start:1012 stop:1761 length:750 start_codon:yes stop_codon:yes gene_type:complete